jgi:hypothetical protein
MQSLIEHFQKDLDEKGAYIKINAEYKREIIEKCFKSDITPEKAKELFLGISFHHHLLLCDAMLDVGLSHDIALSVLPKDFTIEEMTKKIANLSRKYLEQVKKNYLYFPLIANVFKQVYKRNSNGVLNSEYLELCQQIEQLLVGKYYSVYIKCGLPEEIVMEWCLENQFNLTVN